MSLTSEFNNVFNGKGNALVKIIAINVIVFVLVNLSISIVSISGGSEFDIIKWLGIPSGLNLFLARFWTLFTYMFTHANLMHILFNMLWLYWIGQIFIEYLGVGRFTIIYILGGLIGGALYLLVSLILPSFLHHTFLIGASASVMAIVISTAILLPDYTLFLILIGPVKLKYIALVSFLLTTVLDFSQNTGGKIAHIGGALMGYIFIIQYKNGNDITRFFTKLKLKRGKMSVAYNKKKVSDEEYNLSKAAQQRLVDEILDKISKSGYESLNKEEKDILFKASKQ